MLISTFINTLIQSKVSVKLFNGPKLTETNNEQLHFIIIIYQKCIN